MSVTATDYHSGNQSSTNSSSKVWKFVGCGCLALFVIGALGFGGLFYGFFKLLRNNDPYRDSIAAVQGNPAAIAALGEPIKPGIFMTGNISFNNDSGSVNFRIPVSGPKGKGTIQVRGTRANSHTGWVYDVWELRVKGQPDPIPLGNALE